MGYQATDLLSLRPKRANSPHTLDALGSDSICELNFLSNILDPQEKVKFCPTYARGEREANSSATVQAGEWRHRRISILCRNWHMSRALRADNRIILV